MRLYLGIALCIGLIFFGCSSDPQITATDTSDSTDTPPVEDVADDTTPTEDTTSPNDDAVNTDLADLQSTEDATDAGEVADTNDQEDVADTTPPSDVEDTTDAPPFEPPVIPTECPDIGLEESTGTIHYVCDCGSLADSDCVPGDDSMNGTSPATAWRTYERARAGFSQMAAGDTLAFCSGGHFTVDDNVNWGNTNCLATQVCVVRDYPPSWASGDEERPIISSHRSAFKFMAPEHEEGFVLMNLDLHGSVVGSGFFFYNDIDDVLMCNVRVDGFHLGVHVAASNSTHESSDGRNDRIVLRNSDIRNNDGQGWLGGCDDCGVAYSTFVNNGYEKVTFNHNVYFSGSNDPAHNMFAIGNDLSENTMVDGACHGVSLVVHGKKENLLIEGNTLHEQPGAVGHDCWGIAVDGSYGEEEGFKNLIIRNNTLINMGNLSIGANVCQNCLIENNVVVQTNPVGGWTIRVPSKDENPADIATTNVTVRNNSIYIGGNSGARGIYVSDVGANHVVVNNAVLHASTSNSACFELALPTTAYATVDHNICHSIGSGDLAWMQGMDLASWNGSTGFDASSLDSDPAFNNVNAHDLSPAPGSPMIDAGHPSLSSVFDHLGWPRDDAPDMGAYEHH